jgi:hypothetical protein
VPVTTYVAEATALLPRQVLPVAAAMACKTVVAFPGAVIDVGGTKLY